MVVVDATMLSRLHCDLLAVREEALTGDAVRASLQSQLEDAEKIAADAIAALNKAKVERAAARHPARTAEGSDALTIFVCQRRFTIGVDPAAPSDKHSGC